MMKYVAQFSKEGVTPAELRQKLAEVGFKMKYKTLVCNVIHPAYKLGLLTRKEGKYIAVMRFEDCRAWRNPKYYYDPVRYLPRVKRYAEKNNCSRELAFVKLYPEKVIDVAKALQEIIRNGGRPDPNIGAVKLIKFVNEAGLSNILKK
jgi:hypothetical protein